MTTAIIESQPRAISVESAAPANSPIGMMLAAMNQGATLEQVEKMMDLQERWQKGEAKKAYDAAFAAFKAEGVKIIKGSDVKDGPLKGRSYAELHDVVNAVTPALSKHGLSSSWKLTRDEKDWMEVTCYLRHVGGHEESVSMGGPPDTGGAKNAIQARASTKTYLERYTLKGVTGLSEEGDDTDGNQKSDMTVIDDWVAAMEDAPDQEALETTWRDGLNEIKKTNSLNAYERFRIAYQSSKKRLNGVKK